jgi:uncharacterized protein with PQ loop repeat
LTEEVIKQTLSVVGTTLQIARALPYALRVLRTRQVDADGAMGVDLLLLSGIWWVVYALDIGNLPTLVSSLAGLVPAAVTLWVLWRSGHLHARAVALLVLGLLLVPVAIESSRTAAVVAAAATAIIGVPSAIGVLRRPESIAQTSLATWGLVGVNATVWLAYGILIRHPILGAAGVVQLPCCLVILGRGLRQRRERNHRRLPLGRAT